MHKEAEGSSPLMIQGHEFEALKWRLENQTELLYRLTTIDLQLFSGYITLQLAIGAWLATNHDKLSGQLGRIGVMVLLDLVLAIVASGLLYNNYRRRKEAAEITRKCRKAMAFDKKGAYLVGETLDVPTVFRPWVWLYFLGIAATAIGIGVVAFGRF